MNHLKRSPTKSLTVSFSGAGHLLPYHLGVSLALLEQISLTETSKRLQRRKQNTSPNHNISTHLNSSASISIPPIKAVAGSSSGAIAAVIFAKLPHRLEEYAKEFMETRGKALEILSTMLLDEERHWSSESSSGSGDNNVTESATVVSVDQRKRRNAPSLYVATTKCDDGSTNLFRFNTNEMYSSISSSWNTDSILEAAKASCTIPLSFHPVDLLPGLFVDKLSYPNEEGVYIDGSYHVDGGISSPAPIIPSIDNSCKGIVVSPISHGLSGNSDEESYYRISPTDDSWRLLPVQNIKCRNDFLVKPSLQNLRALRVAGGMASSKELRKWYELGFEDGNRSIEAWKDKEIFL